MSFKIHSRTGRYQADASDFKAFLGYPEGGHYPPDESHGVTVAGTGPNGEPVGILLFLITRDEAKAEHPKSTRPHRVYARCPGCERFVPAGRTHQHKCRKG